MYSWAERVQRNYTHLNWAPLHQIQMYWRKMSTEMNLKKITTRKWHCNNAYSKHLHGRYLCVETLERSKEKWGKEVLSAIVCNWLCRHSQILVPCNLNPDSVRIRAMVPGHWYYECSETWSMGGYNISRLLSMFPMSHCDTILMEWLVTLMRCYLRKMKKKQMASFWFLKIIQGEQQHVLLAPSAVVVLTLHCSVLGMM